MDKYESLLESKIENARSDIEFHYPPTDGEKELEELRGELSAYIDALNEYRQFKAKEGKNG